MFRDILQISRSEVREISLKTACQTTLPAWYLDTMDMGLSRPLPPPQVQNTKCKTLSRILDDEGEDGDVEFDRGNHLEDRKKEVEQRKELKRLRRKQSLRNTDETAAKR